MFQAIAHLTLAENEADSEKKEKKWKWKKKKIELWVPNYMPIMKMGAAFYNVIKRIFFTYVHIVR